MRFPVGCRIHRRELKGALRELGYRVEHKGQEIHGMRRIRRGRLHVIVRGRVVIQPTDPMKLHVDYFAGRRRDHPVVHEGPAIAEEFRRILAKVHASAVLA